MCVCTCACMHPSHSHRAPCSHDIETFGSCPVPNVRMTFRHSAAHDIETFGTGQHQGGGQVRILIVERNVKHRLPADLCMNPSRAAAAAVGIHLSTRRLRAAATDQVTHARSGEEADGGRALCRHRQFERRLAVVISDVSMGEYGRVSTAPLADPAKGLLRLQQCDRARVARVCAWQGHPRALPAEHVRAQGVCSSPPP